MGGNKSPADAGGNAVTAAATLTQTRRQHKDRVRHVQTSKALACSTLLQLRPRETDNAARTFRAGGAWNVHARPFVPGTAAGPAGKDHVTVSHNKEGAHQKGEDSDYGTISHTERGQPRAGRGR